MSATDDGHDGDDGNDPALTGSGGEDISGGIMPGGAGGRALDDDQDPGHSDLDEVIGNSRSQPEHRAETG